MSLHGFARCARYHKSGDLNNRLMLFNRQMLFPHGAGCPEGCRNALDEGIDELGPLGRKLPGAQNRAAPEVKRHQHRTSSIFSSCVDMEWRSAVTFQYGPQPRNPARVQALNAFEEAVIHGPVAHPHA
jgi:hypothetical protein